MEKLQKQIEKLEKQSAEETAVWSAGKSAIGEAGRLREALDKAKTAVELALREGQYEKAGELVLLTSSKAGICFLHCATQKRS